MLLEIKIIDLSNMKKIIYSLLAIGFLSSCGDGNNTTGEARKAKGGVYYGGVFRMNEVEDFRNLFPLNITETTSHRIANQVYEGLVKLSQGDLTISPSLAEKVGKKCRCFAVDISYS